MKSKFEGNLEGISLSSLEEIPPPKKLLRLISWSIPALILSLIIVGFIYAGKDTAQHMLISWVVANSSLAALGALLSFAHPLTILTVIITAPFTSLNPTIAAGWVAGLLEVAIRKPKVSDFESAANDASSLKGLYTNRIWHVLIVTALTNLGSTAGTFVGGYFVAQLAVGA